ncbi:hypothetical protein [Mycobacterium colombiense]|uniref:hypothetical protein n=1 Tax=Mycobacterium colombiense TaxID=339268 RepID=UPI000A821E9F|nr:hypothetical protein [Mycobacterium colombiense]
MRRNDRAIARILVSAAVVFGSGVLAAPAGADPNPFNTLSSSCNQTAPGGRDALLQGIRRGISDWSAAAPHTSARTTCGANPTPTTG